jgi:thiamine biosynthesis protein ThiS
VRITLNGDPYDLEQPVSVQELLERLNIDPRRVAVEHNMVIVRRHAFAATLVGDGDEVEIVNFVGGGGSYRGWSGHAPTWTGLRREK